MGNELTGADEKEAGRYEAGRVNGIAAARQKQRICPGWSARLGGLAGLAGRVGRHDGQGRGARRAGSGGTEGRVRGHHGPGRLAWRAGLAGMAGRVQLGGQAGAGRVVWQERAGWCGRSGPGRSGSGWAGQDRANLITCESELHGWESRMPCPILSHMGIPETHQ